MAQDVVLGQERFKKRSPVGVWLLALVTLGVYGLVYWYKINSEARRYLADEKIKPDLAVLALLPGAFILVPPFVTVFKTGRRVQRMEERAGLMGPASPGLTLLLSFLWSLHIVYLQSHLNRIWDAYLASGAAAGAGAGGYVPTSPPAAALPPGSPYGGYPSTAPPQDYPSTYGTPGYQDPAQQGPAYPAGSTGAGYADMPGSPTYPAGYSSPYPSSPAVQPEPYGSQQQPYQPVQEPYSPAQPPYPQAHDPYAPAQPPYSPAQEPYAPGQTPYPAPQQPYGPAQNQYPAAPEPYAPFQGAYQPAMEHQPGSQEARPTPEGYPAVPATPAQAAPAPHETAPTAPSDTTRAYGGAPSAIPAQNTPAPRGESGVAQAASAEGGTSGAAAGTAQPASAATTIPAGWYPDPSGQAAKRWWDGHGWTAHTAP